MNSINFFLFATTLLAGSLPLHAMNINVNPFAKASKNLPQEKSANHSSPFIKELESGNHQSMLSFFNAVATGKSESEKIDSFLDQMKNSNKDLPTIDDDLYSAILKRVAKNDNFAKLIDETKEKYSIDNATVSYQDESFPPIVKNTIEKFKLNFPLTVVSVGNSWSNPSFYGKVTGPIDTNNNADCKLEIEKAVLKKTDDILKGIVLHEMSHLQKDHIIARGLLKQNEKLLNWTQEYQADTATIYKDRRNTRALSCNLHDMKSEEDAYFFKALVKEGALLAVWLGISYTASTLPQDVQNTFTRIIRHGYLMPSYLILESIYKKYKYDTHPPINDRIKNVKLVGKLVKTAEMQKHSSNLD